MTAAEAKSGKYTYYVCHSLLKRGSGPCKTPRLNAKSFEELIVTQYQGDRPHRVQHPRPGEAAGRGRWTGWPPSSVSGWRASTRSLRRSSGSWAASGTPSLFALALYPIGVGFVLFALQLRRMVAERRSVWEVDNALVCMSMDNSRDRGAAALQRPGDLSDRVTRRELLSGLDHELAWQALSSVQRSRTWATWWALRSGVTAAGDVVLPAEAGWGKSVCRGKCV